MQIKETHSKRSLSSLKTNTTLEQVMLYDKKNAGFTKCPTETKPVQRFYQPKIYDESMADQMLHYMRLNRCGRNKSGRKEPRKRNSLKFWRERKKAWEGVLEASLDLFNVVFGLLVESAPSLWSAER